jgi:hypothetical protein
MATPWVPQLLRLIFAADRPVESDPAVKRAGEEVILALESYSVKANELALPPSYIERYATAQGKANESISAFLHPKQESLMILHLYRIPALSTLILVLIPTSFVDPTFAPRNAAYIGFIIRLALSLLFRRAPRATWITFYSRYLMTLLVPALLAVPQAIPRLRWLYNRSWYNSLYVISIVPVYFGRLHWIFLQMDRMRQCRLASTSISVSQTQLQTLKNAIDAIYEKAEAFSTLVKEHQLSEKTSINIEHVMRSLKEAWAVSRLSTSTNRSTDVAILFPSDNLTSTKLVLCILGLCFQTLTIYTLWGNWISALQCVVYSVYVVIWLLELSYDGTTLQVFVSSYAIFIISNLGSFLLVSIPLLYKSVIFERAWVVIVLVSSDAFFTFLLAEPLSKLLVKLFYSLVTFF